MADVKKETVMLLKVDLECSSCYRKVKKLLCKFPQIRDQIYDVKNNTVRITVVCCSPENIRDKLCCKGGKTIKSIEILPPPPPPKPKEPEKKKEPEKPKEPTPTEKPKPPQEKPAEKPKVVVVVPPEKPKEPEKPKDAPKPKPPPAEKPKDTPKPAPIPVPVPVAPTPQPYPVPVGFCCPQCFDGLSGGPCYHGYGQPVAPPPCYCDHGYYGYGYGYGSQGRCDCFSEESTSVCRIM